MTSEAEVWATFAAASLAHGARPDVAANRADGLLELFHDRFVPAPEGSDNWDRRKPDEPMPSPAPDEPVLDFTQKG